jgi:hypothetical protein
VDALARGRHVGLGAIMSWRIWTIAMMSRPTLSIEGRRAD